MVESAISLQQMGKMYRRYRSPLHRVMEELSLIPSWLWKGRRGEEFWALRYLDLEISRGERVGIVGRNGAGKTTLLKMIVGNAAPSEGNITVNGRIQALMELGTGFHPDFTGRQNIAASLAYQGVSGAQIRDIEEEIIEFTELHEFIDQPTRTYSAGMYVRLAFAVATSVKPDILVIDEILGAGDAAFAAKCSERMKSLTEGNGTTLLFVSHSMPSVIEMCDRAILIQRGEVTHDAGPIEISKVYNSIIRREEELYYRAKERKLRKQDLQRIEQVGDHLKPLLFRLTTPGGAKKSGSNKQTPPKIQQVSLSADGEVVADVAVGGPMDNDPTSFNRVIDGWGTNWGPAERNARGNYRSIVTSTDQLPHAPLQLCLPIHEEHKLIDLSISTADSAAVEVHQWDGTSYRPLASLIGSPAVLTLQNLDDTAGAPKRFTVPVESALAGEEANVADDADSQRTPSENNSISGPVLLDAMSESHSIYGDGSVKVLEADLLNAKCESARVLQVGEAVEGVVTLQADETVGAMIFVCAILTTDGRTAGQVFCPSTELGLDHLRGTAKISFRFDPLRYGAGEYVMSFGVFDAATFDFSRESEDPSFCVLDRVLFFKVQQPGGMGKQLGACISPVTWRCGAQTYRYDPAEPVTVKRAA